MTNIDRSKTRSRTNKFLFQPLYVDEQRHAPVELGAAGFADDTELVVIERGGLERAFLVREMSYHHLAQGGLAGEPYLVSF